MLYYLKKHWKINLLVSFLLTTLSGIMVYLNMIMILEFQCVIERDMYGLVLWTILDALLWIAVLVVEGASSWAQSKAVCSMNNHLRKDITATLIKKSHQEFHLHQSGEYLSWYTNDINYIETKAWNAFFSLISTLSKILFSMLALAKLHWSLLVASLLAATVIINTPNLFREKIEILSANLAEQQANGTSKMKELLAGLDVLRSFGRIDRFVSGNQEASEQFEEPKHKLNYTQAFIGEGIDLVNIICQIFVNFLVGILSIKGIILQGALMGGGNLCSATYNGLATLGQLRISIISSKPYFEKITTHADDAISQIEGNTRLMNEAIKMDGVSFSYGTTPILHKLSLRFEKGGKYAITGPSGCGKSTLLKLLLGWLPGYSGKIYFDNKDAKYFTADQLQQQISYIEQDVFLFNTTIRDNITLGKNFSDDQLAKAIQDSALGGDLQNMEQGLDTLVGEAGNLLSGGQKQRVAIARALIHNRSILLVDEGTSALDQQNATIVENSLLNNPDLTLLLVSHHLTPERKAQFQRVIELEPVAIPLEDVTAT